MKERLCKICGKTPLHHTHPDMLCEGFKTQYEPDDSKEGIIPSHYYHLKKLKEEGYAK